MLRRLYKYAIIKEACHLHLLRISIFKIILINTTLYEKKNHLCSIRMYVVAHYGSGKKSAHANGGKSDYR